MRLAAPSPAATSMGCRSRRFAQTADSEGDCASIRATHAPAGRLIRAGAEVYADCAGLTGGLQTGGAGACSTHETCSTCGRLTVGLALLDSLPGYSWWR